MWFLYDPNFLLLRISFLYCIKLHPDNHYCFSKISRPFCGSRNWWIIVVFLQSNSLRITIVSQKYQDFLQSYSHDRFLQNIENFLFKKKIVKNRRIPSTHAERKLPIFLMNNLLLYIPLLALTHRQNYGRRNKYTRYAWAGGTFFPVVLLCQFSVLVGNRFWCYILLMYLEYNTVVVLC
jgi:hypothetical protein